MSTGSSVIAHLIPANRRTHHLIPAGIFAILGFHVGVWAVQVANLSAALRLDPGSLGAVMTTASGAGIVTLFAGGRLADRLGRRVVLVLGFGGTAAAFSLLSQVRSLHWLVPAVVSYGLFVSFIDMGANAVGADYEHTYGVQAMTGLHAGFSLGALLGALTSAMALWARMGFRSVYLGLAAVLAVAAVVVLVAPLPPCGGAEAASAASHHGCGVWRTPTVTFAISLVAITFFGDGALESFLAVYLRHALAAGVLLSGVGIGSYHLASLMGRVVAARIQRRWGERRIIVTAGLLAAAGISVAVGTHHVALAIGGLLLVGFAVAPVVPTALSLAGRSAPGRSGQAVATTTAAGYSAFIVSPILVGAIADASSLRLGLAILIVTTVGIAALGLTWPTNTPTPFKRTGPRQQPSGSDQSQGERGRGHRPARAEPSRDTDLATPG